MTRSLLNAALILGRQSGRTALKKEGRTRLETVPENTPVAGRTSRIRPPLAEVSCRKRLVSAQF